MIPLATSSACSTVLSGGRFSTSLVPTRHQTCVCVCTGVRVYRRACVRESGLGFGLVLGLVFSGLDLSVRLPDDDNSYHCGGMSRTL